MYENLGSVMAREGVSIQDVAGLLGVHRDAASAKVGGEAEFSIQEAFDLHGRYFKQYSLEWTFRKKEEGRDA